MFEADKLSYDREVEYLNKLKGDPFVIKFIENFENTSGQACILTEFIDGCDLEEFINERYKGGGYFKEE